MKDLTVAICMYNAEIYIEETLSCLMAQTEQDFYLLIVNDCSTDNSVKIVNEFFYRHPRQYELVNFEENRGLCAGRRYVEENANTKYLLFVDADDCPHETLVEKLYHTISSDSDLMAVGCYQEFIDSKGKKMVGGIFLGETSKEAFRKKAEAGKLIFMQPTAIYDRKLALTVGGHCVDGFPEGKPRYRDLCEDLDLWTRMSDLYIDGKAIVVVPDILCGYRKHEQAMSTNSIGMILRMKYIKGNVRRRREGMSDITFIEFLQILSAEERKRIENEAKSSDSLRNSFYKFRKFRFFSGCYYLLKSLWYKPDYLVSKIKHNILRLK